MLLGFILGLAAGVILAAAWEANYEYKKFEEELEQLEQEAIEENYESFTYDCMNDPDPVEEDKHIPRIN